MSSLLTAIEETVLARHDGKVLAKDNPMSEILSRGLAAPTGHGLYVLGGPLARLMGILDSRLRRLSLTLGAHELHVPGFLSPESARLSGYREGFAQQALNVARESSPPEVVGLACPTVCHHYFAFVKAGAVAAPRLITARASCSRYETGTLPDLRRLVSFSMREIVGLGARAQCQKAMETIRRASLAFFESELDLSYELTTASDPFFGELASLKQKAQLLEGSKEEARALIPFDHSTSAVSSFNRHGTTFVKRFGLACVDDELESFCVGFGLERLLFALLSQKGTDFESPFYRRLLEESR